MNYLAHLFFSEATPLAWSGSLMGDFHKGSDFSGLPKELVLHLQLHRFIDGLTRSNPHFQNSRRRFHPRFRHGRSVLVDVYYDHFLARHWSQFSGQPLTDFSSRVYAGLQQSFVHLSPGLQQQLPRMIAGDWLSSYCEQDVVAKVLKRLEERLQGKVSLSQAWPLPKELRQALLNDFFHFMTEVTALVAAWKRSHGIL